MFQINSITIKTKDYLKNNKLSHHNNDENEDKITDIQSELSIIKYVNKNPCWFWGITSLDFDNNKDISFKTQFIINNDYNDYDDEEYNEDDEQEQKGSYSSIVKLKGDKCIQKFNSMTIGFIVYEEKLSMYNDELTFEKSSTLRVDFGNTFHNIPNVILSIQAIDSSQLIYFNVEVVEVKNKYCRVKADFDEDFINSITVGIFAYDKQYTSDEVKTKLNNMENEMKELKEKHSKLMKLENEKDQEQQMKEEIKELKKKQTEEKSKLIYIQSDTIVEKRSEGKKIDLSLYETYPKHFVSFINGVKGINKATFPLNSSLQPYDSDSMILKIESEGNYISVSHSYIICSSICDFSYHTYKTNDNIEIRSSSQEIFQLVNENLNVCKSCEDEDKCCIECKKHRINTVFSCGHGFYCNCCAHKLSSFSNCPTCNKIPSMILYFDEFVEF